MAKPKITVQRFSDDCSNVSLGAELNNKTPIQRSAGMMLCTCEVCSTQFFRKASEVKRNAHTYCGRACAGFACRNRVTRNCRICGAEYLVIASQAEKITCCSKQCKHKSHGVDALRVIKSGGNPKLFEHQSRKIPVSVIPKILIDTRTHREIALSYGVSRASISYIKRKHK
jgi:hypothetical protein